MNEFRSWISDNGLVEADAIGKKYTWSNCRSGAQRIVSKHDRAVVNDSWCYKYANWRCKALPRVCSDHSLLFGFAFENPKPARVPFRIQKMWLSHPDFMRLVEENWNLELNVADAKKVVDDVRTELAVILKMKSRVTWLEDGDQNTRFFHNSIRLRRSQNTISELKVSNDTTLFLQDEIKDFIFNHYQSKFNGGDVNIDPSIFDIDHESISSAESAFMDAIPSLEEVKVAVFDLGDDSAPGPDGFTGSFYRQCWDIISRDLFNAIANCWAMRKIPNGINSSFIVLIPKNNKSDVIKYYQPIGLSNFFFKIITKIMATRLGTVLNKLISEEQVEFMKGRNIHKNIALACELINEISTERKHGNVGLKLDIAQSFDTVRWDFIAEIFRQYGFSNSWCTGNLHSLQNLKNMLVLYQHASGQCVNYAKSKFYYGGGTLSRAIAISNYLGMERVIFPDKYLGIQLKPGIVRHIHVRQVVEKIMDKLAGWKGKLLSFQARLVIIKSIISRYVIYSMDIYKWPCTVIKQVERAIRNFLWSGDAEKRKYFTVLYDDLCLSKREGGLGIKKLNDVNREILMKLWISIRDSNKIWAKFLRAKLGITSKGPNGFRAKVSDIIVDGAWSIPQKTRDLMIRCNIDVDDLPIIAGGEDYTIWDLDSKGVFSAKSAKAAIKVPAEVVPTAALFTRQVVHPTLIVQYWKI
ncbi:uncharacterized protein LOC113272845 [Papaver somniferum]|uniref:uncharacterized protein LOC113272845 n=1 Tax=Papaver somniferum TaxID=3469 RepID=UPI000E6F4F1C|nr:uncharacterized protein LOC113272845 [Papaver somniferum]